MPTTRCPPTSAALPTPSRPGPRDHPRPRGAGGHPRRTAARPEPGQQHPAADAIHAAHTQPTRTRRDLRQLQNLILRLSRLAWQVATILKEDRVVILAWMRPLWPVGVAVTTT